MLLGLTGVALPLACQNVGLRVGEATNTTLLFNGATPILAGLLAAVVLGERLTGPPLLGPVASALGVACVVLAGASGVGVAARGDGLFLLGSASRAVYVVAARQCPTPTPRASTRASTVGGRGVRRRSDGSSRDFAGQWMSG